MPSAALVWPLERVAVAARHARSLLNEPDAADMARDPEEVGNPRRVLPPFPVHRPAWMQERIAPAGNRSPPAGPLRRRPERAHSGSDQ